MRIFFITAICCFIFGVPLTSHAQRGYWEWARSGTDLGIAETNKLATDEQGNVYATGVFTGKLALGVAPLQGWGKRDVFIVKYNASGQLLWAQSLKGPEEDAGTAIATDGQNVYVTGSFTDTLTDGSVGLSGFGDKDVFIVCYDNAGNLKWLQRGGGNYEERAVDIQADKQGNIYIAGEFGNYPGSPKPDSAFAYFGTDTLLGLGGRELYLVKYDTQGNVVWARAIGGEFGKEIMGNIALDVNGNIVIGGGLIISR